MHRLHYWAEAAAALVGPAIFHLWPGLQFAISLTSLLCGCILGLHGVINLFRGRPSGEHHIHEEHDL